METHNAPARVRRDLVARDVKNMVFVFALVSFLGWCTEMLACYPFSGWQDRGFLTLPFCTIYGTAALFYYYAFGLPQEPRFFKLRVFQGNGAAAFLRYAYYFFVTASFSIPPFPCACGITSAMRSIFRVTSASAFR